MLTPCDMLASSLNKIPIDSTYVKSVNHLDRLAGGDIMRTLPDEYLTMMRLDHPRNVTQQIINAHCNAQHDLTLCLVNGLGIPKRRG